MPAWKDSLRPASFRGVPFKVEDHQASAGRRLQVTEYPERDEPLVEDLGRKARRWKIVGYVIGPNYMPSRDAVIKACEEKGPGTLVHPYLGELQVRLETLETRETRAEGGMCRFDLQFVEAGANRYPAPTADNRAGIRTQADVATVAAEGDFSRRYRVNSLPDFLADDSGGLLSQLADAVSGARGLSAGANYRLDTRLAGFSQGGAPLARDASLPRQTSGLLQTLRSALSPSQGFSALRLLQTFGSDLPALSFLTPTRRQQDINRDAFVMLVRRDSVIEQARLASYVEYADPTESLAYTSSYGSQLAAGSAPEWQQTKPSLSDPLPPFDPDSSALIIPSRDEAIQFRDRLAADMELEIVAAGDVGDDASYEALMALKKTLLLDIAQRSAGLAPIIRYKLARGVPALVLAQLLYKDEGRADELARRNGVAHPAFMPAEGEALSP